IPGQLAQAPVGERLDWLLRPGPGRRDDDPGIAGTDQAGAAPRLPRGQRGQALGAERMDHVPPRRAAGAEAPARPGLGPEPWGPRPPPCPHARPPAGGPPGPACPTPTP